MARPGSPVEQVKKWLSRLFFSGTDEDSVDTILRAYARGLYVTAKGFSKTPGDPFDEIAVQLEAQIGTSASSGQAPESRPSAPEIFALESKLVQLYPTEHKQRRYWEHRDRFERVALPTELAAYLASNPPPPPDPSASPPVVSVVNDADSLMLLDHIHRDYLETVVREQAVGDLKRWVQFGLLRSVFGFGALILILALVFLYFSEWRDDGLYFAIGLSLLYMIGRLGAAMSVVQRLQRAVREPGRDPFFEVTALCMGRRGVSIAMMSGGVFAVLLYVVFGAGLGQQLGMSGGIFPEVRENSAADAAPDAGRPRTDEQGNPAAGPAATAGAKPAVEAPARPSPAPVQAAGAAAPATGKASPTRMATASTGEPQSKAGRTVTAGTPQGVRGASKRDRLADADCTDVNCVPRLVQLIGKHLGFANYPDFFKMLLLAFLAGFAERLVPDAIDRLAPRNGTQAQRAAAATVRAGSS